MKILVTGAAGFIGFHLTEALLKNGNMVVGIDNINDYYDVNLKYARLKESGVLRENVDWRKDVQSIKYPQYKFIRMNLEDKDVLMNLCKQQSFDMIIHLAAQVNVRYASENPDIYVQSNVVGFLNVLEAARHNSVKQLIYASSSSVYGMNSETPFRIENRTDSPISLYAATKKANELMAHTYSHLYGISTIGLRFFTVYGPWGRPDMACFLFSDAIRYGKPIKVFNKGNLKRDFTYIDDVVSGVLNIIKSVANKQYQLYNIGNSQPIALLDFIKEIEKCMGKESIKEFMDIQQGDVLETWADVADFTQEYGYKPCTPITEGIRKFVEWYNEYYNRQPVVHFKRC